MPFGVPVTPGEVVKNEATSIVTAAINRAITAADAGDNVGAAQGFFQATAVSAAFVAGTLIGFTYYPVSGLSQALRNLANDPGKFEQVLAYLLPKLGLATDPLVISRLATISKPFAGGAAAAYLTNELIDFANSANVGSSIYDWTHDSQPAISPTLGTLPDPLVKTIRYVDPLVLDLDGDGLEITPLSAGVLFDANADTLKTGTAWVRADDGILVRDLNGNGLIDSGRELFGDETILTTGPSAGTKASNGFTALADLNSNGDAVFNASDAQFANLRIWRDLNQDGVSQAGELQTLAAAGVQSIKLASTPTTQQFGDAMLLQNGSYTRVDAGGATSLGQAGSFILAQNNFTTSFAPIAVSAAAKALPAISGSGWVRGLQEAANEYSWSLCA